MYLLDSNVLIYAHLSGLPEFPVVHRWLEDALNKAETVMVTESVLLSFIRLTTNKKIFAPALTAAQCREVFEDLFAFPNFLLHQPETPHYLQLAALMKKHNLADNDTMDAHLACIALATKATLVTSDKGFKRFPYVKVLNPTNI